MSAKKRSRILIALVSVALLVMACSVFSGGASGPVKNTAAPVTLTPGEERPTATETEGPRVSTATQAPTEEPSPQATETPALPAASFGGVSFSYDPSLFAAANGVTIPAVGQDAAPWEVAPEHIEFSFDQYTLQGTFHEPKMIIYPVKGLIEAQPQAEDVVNSLRQLTEEQPNPAPDRLPFLPFWNAASMIRTNVEYLTFQNGKGMRYLTQFGQDVSPITNSQFFYTFQGITDDGQYYVAAIFPVNNPVLPDDPEQVINGDYDTFSKNFETYLQDLKQKLDEQPPNSFKPDLTMLDELINSLIVTP